LQKFCERPVVTVAPEQTSSEACQLSQEMNDGRDKVMGMVTLDNLLVLLGEEMSGVGKSVSAALLRNPAAAEPGEAPFPLQWITSYL
jgi:hypothetical protein